MNDKEIMPEELLKEIWTVMKSFNILWMTTYMDLDASIYNIWKKRKTLPYRNVKWIIEYLEMHNDDCVTLCWHLLDYFKQEAKKREERVIAAREKNKQRNRERWLRMKEAKNK